MEVYDSLSRKIQAVDRNIELVDKVKDEFLGGIKNIRDRLPSIVDHISSHREANQIFLPRTRNQQIDNEREVDDTISETLTDTLDKIEEKFTDYNYIDPNIRNLHNFMNKPNEDLTTETKIYLSHFDIDIQQLEAEKILPSKFKFAASFILLLPSLTPQHNHNLTTTRPQLDHNLNTTWP